MKRVVCVLFGGCSAEHEVSLVSGRTVLSHLDPERYEICAAGITRSGRPASPVETVGMAGQAAERVHCCELLVEPGGSSLVRLTCRDAEGRVYEPDVVFPVLHGPFGEDGTLQGLVELADLPLVGCSVAASAVAMDKVLAKRLAREVGLAVAPFLEVHRTQWETDEKGVVHRVSKEIPGPWFVKPVRMGSSVGIARVTEAEALSQALTEAFRFDYRVLVEQGLDAREIEVSVLGNGPYRTSSPGEIEPSREFYDYEAKYVDGTSGLLVPAPLTSEETRLVRDLAARAFGAVAGEGFGRVDFLLERATGTFYFNEINTIPGFTEISMFPKLWVHDGWTIRSLLDELVRLAFERHTWRSGLSQAPAA